MNSIRGPIQGNGTRFVVTVGSPETLTPSANAVSRARRIAYSSETPRSLRFTRNSYAPRRLDLARAAREPKPAGEPTAGRPTTGGTSITRCVRTLGRDDRLPAATRGLRDGHGPAFTDRTSRMIDLDPEQRAILMWILHEGSGEVVLAPVPGTDEVDLVIPRGPRRRVAQADLGRLVDLLVIVHVQRKIYRITELGREAVRSAGR
jgi:hypothetical protein